MSKKFKDNQGREYKIKVTIPLLRWIRDEIDVDLGKPEAFIALSNNPIDLVNVIYMLVKEQADKYKLTDVEFGESIDGDVLEESWDAFCQAYLSFCPSHQADLLRKLMATAKRAEYVSTSEVEVRLARLVDSFKSDLKSADASESSQATIPLGN